MSGKAITAEGISAVTKQDAELASICEYSSTNFKGILLCEDSMGDVC